MISFKQLILPAPAVILIILFGSLLLVLQYAIYHDATVIYKGPFVITGWTDDLDMKVQFDNGKMGRLSDNTLIKEMMEKKIDITDSTKYKFMGSLYPNGKVKFEGKSK